MPQMISMTEKSRPVPPPRQNREIPNPPPQGSGPETPTPMFDPNEDVKLDGVEEVSTVAPPEVKPPTDETPTTEVKPPAEEPKTDTTEVKFDIPEDKEEPPAKPTKPAPTEIPAGPRNYDEYPEEIRPVLRALNNTQFKNLAPKLKELVEKAAKTAELEERVGKQPQFFHEHPEAYRLSPEFQQLEQSIQYVQFEQSHWQEQLLKIKRGEAWQRLKGYDSRSGQPVFETVEPPADGKPDYASETQVTGLLQQLGNLAFQRNQELAGYQQGYQQSVQNSAKMMEEVDKRLFPALPDLGKLVGEEKNFAELSRNLVPPHFKNHPLTIPLVKSSVMFYRLAQKHHAALKEIRMLKAQLEDRGAAEIPVIPPGGGATANRLAKPLKRGEIDPDEDVKLGGGLDD